MSKKKQNNYIVKRYIIFLIGLFVNSLGVALITKANLGTSPISSIPYVLSLNYPFTLGNFTIFFSILLIVLQLILLGKNFKVEHLLQIPVSLIFGYFIDACMILLGFVNPHSYPVKVIDLLIPIVSLVICCVIGLIYTGGFYSGTDFVTAFSLSDASVGLVLGSFFGLVITIVLYLIRRVMNFRDCMACIPDGFKAMVPAILILTFAWTLKAMTDSLGASVFVSAIVKSSAGGLMNFLPAIIFVIGAVIAFATGTSWGTFGILIPIVVNVFSGTNQELMIFSISACMAGAVCGDHCSPISDTTIMASAGAQCEHVNHVSTQLPYAMVAAAVSFLTYIIAGFVQTAWIALPAGIILMAITLVIIRLKFDDLKM